MWRCDSRKPSGDEIALDCNISVAIASELKGSQAMEERGSPTARLWDTMSIVVPDSGSRSPAVAAINVLPQRCLSHYVSGLWPLSVDGNGSLLRHPPY